MPGGAHHVRALQPGHHQLVVNGRDSGVVQKASANARPGQLVRRVCDASGTPTELWVGGTQLLPKDAMLAEATLRYRKARTAPLRTRSVPCAHPGCVVARR